MTLEAKIIAHTSDPYVCKFDVGLLTINRLVTDAYQGEIPEPIRDELDRLLYEEAQLQRQVEELLAREVGP